MKPLLLSLLLLPSLSMADARYEVITVHDDFLGALQCYGHGYRYFKRLAPDKVMCLKGLDDLSVQNRAGAQDAKRYVIAHAPKAPRS